MAFREKLRRFLNPNDDRYYYHRWAAGILAVGAFGTGMGLAPIYGSPDKNAVNTSKPAEVIKRYYQPAQPGFPPVYLPSAGLYWIDTSTPAKFYLRLKQCEPKCQDETFQVGEAAFRAYHVGQVIVLNGLS